MIDFEMIDVTALAIAFILGTALSGIYFGTLWLTVRRLVHNRQPAVFLMLSLLLRMSVILSCFYLILNGGHWDRLLAALLGFITLRSLLMRKFGPVKITQCMQTDTKTTS